MPTKTIFVVESKFFELHNDWQSALITIKGIL